MAHTHMTVDMWEEGRTPRGHRRGRGKPHTWPLGPRGNWRVREKSQLVLLWWTLEAQELKQI